MPETLKTIVAELLGIDSQQVTPGHALAGGRLQGSIGRSILDAAVRRRLGINSAACYSAKTFGELEMAVTGSNATDTTDASEPLNDSTATLLTTDSAPNVTTSPLLSDVANGASCGVDIEQISNLPVTSDFWTHEFYTAHFTPGEIAYCLTQQSPLQHFAARFCAKEAIKKCEPALMNEPMRNLEVVSSPNAAPSFRHYRGGVPRNLPHGLSLSHTDQSAIAIVIRIPAPPVVITPPAPAPVTSQQPVPQARRSLKPLAFSVIALAVAVAAMVIALKH